MVRFSRSDDCQVAVIGAGPYGLAAAARLNAARVPTRVFGEPMAFWRRNMPRGMRMRSPWRATHIGEAAGAFSIDAYARHVGIEPCEQLPLESFVDYGMWFKDHALGEVDARNVRAVERSGDGFRLTLKDGEAVETRRVVLAMGLANQAFRPEVFAGIPSDLASHSSEHPDLAIFRGKRVSVVGRGQSACESAALLSEAGAEVDLLCRGPIHWLGAGDGKTKAARPLVDRFAEIVRAPSAVGPFPLSWLAEFPGLGHGLPSSVRAGLNERSLKAAASGWLAPRFEQVRVKSGSEILGATVRDGRIVLQLGDGQADYDHALLATGYRIDVARFGVLSSEILAAIDVRGRSPVLSSGFESSVAGLHFVGASAVASFGPLLRFIAGTAFAAQGVTKAILAQTGRSSQAETRFAAPSGLLRGTRAAVD